MTSVSLPPSLEANPRLDQWVAFVPGQQVRVHTGKVELGQGILTVVAQIAAEELDVAPEQVRIVSGVTRDTPNENYTSGSLSVMTSGAAVRLVCAEVRRLLLLRAAEKLSCDPASLSIESGRFLRDGTPTEHDYWTLAPEVDLARSTTGTAQIKTAGDFRLIGRSLPRLDLPAKLKGGAFIHDFAPREALHARVIHQPWRDASLAGFDEETFRRKTRSRIEVLREGNFLALLSSDEYAVEAIVAVAQSLCTWERGSAVPDDAGQVDWLKRQPADSRIISHGSHGAAPDGDYRGSHRALFSRPYLAHGSVAPSCALAIFEDGRLTVWTHSQGVFPLRKALSDVLQVDPELIDVRHQQGAGCYGHNGADDAAFDAAFIATRRRGQLVRVQWTRADELTASPLGAAMAVEVSADMDPQGKPANWALEIWSGPHGQRPGMGGFPNLEGAYALPNPAPRPRLKDVPDSSGGGAARNAFSLYDLPDQRSIVRFLPEIPIRSSSLRALGAFGNVLAIECFMDELAEIAGEDPIEYRLSLLSDYRAREVIEAVRDMSGWNGRSQEAEPSAKALGIGFSRYKNKAAYAAVVAQVEVDEDVRVTHVWAASDAGLVINPDGASNQVEGGIIQAASWTLKEAIRFAEGRPSSVSWDEYPILRFSEVPEVTVRFIERPEESPLGVGEVAQGPTAAAIANATARALGVRIRDLPLTRERILAAIA
ncbi:molybdopterin cofactor-binding domain-containing protein [Microvirga sp. GCM10011540]|uniref:molybdopterin cofactor-binding domain-containing protein n=1 Tax=Microvirga sp. GCM10011540 TaxID=3317338 RepID=UPI00361E6764